MLFDEERKRKLSIDAMSALRSALDGSALGTTANGDDRSGSALEAALDGALAAYEDEPLSPLDQPFPPAETAEQARAQLLARRGLGGGRRQRSYSDQLPRQRQHPAIARAGGGMAMMGGIGVSGIPALSMHLPPRRAGGGGGGGGGDDDGGGGGLRRTLGGGTAGVRSRSGSAASSGGGRSRSGSIGGSTAVQDAAVASAYRRKTSCLDAAAAAMAQGGALQAAFLGAPRGSPVFGAAPPPPPSSPAMPPMQGGRGGGGASAAPRRSPGSSPLSGGPLSDAMQRQSPLRLGSPAHNNAHNNNNNAHNAAFSRGAVLPVPSYRGPAAAQGQPRPTSPSTSPRGSLQRAAALRHHQMTHHLGAPYVSASAPSAVGMWEQLQQKQKQRGVPPPPPPQQQQQQWGAGAGGGAAAAEESSSGGSSDGDSSSDDGEFFGAFGRSAKDRRPSQEWAQLGDDSAGTASEMARLQKQAHLLDKVGAAGGGGEWGTVLSPKQIREQNAKLRPKPARPIVIAAPLAAAAEVAKRGFVWSDSDSDGSMDDFYYATKGQGAGARRSGGKSNSVKQTVQRGVQTAKRAAQRASSKR
jgi:hypothetical protein